MSRYVLVLEFNLYQGWKDRKEVPKSEHVSQLGYRGFIIYLPEGKEPGPFINTGQPLEGLLLEIFNGFIVTPMRAFADTDRVVEKSLLKIAIDRGIVTLQLLLEAGRLAKIT